LASNVLIPAQSRDDAPYASKQDADCDLIFFVISWLWGGEILRGMATVCASRGSEWPEKDEPAMSMILIVDDDPSIRILLKQFLEDSGFLSQAVGDAERAFITACHMQPALMLIDYMLPKSNGAELVHRLQTEAATRAIPLALMSSARPRLPHMQGIPFLPKPFEIIELLELIQRHMQDQLAS
jgi:CheY-like chemotaxis protein